MSSGWLYRQGSLRAKTENPPRAEDRVVLMGKEKPEETLPIYVEGGMFWERYKP